MAGCGAVTRHTVPHTPVASLSCESRQAILDRGTLPQKLKPGGRKVPFAVASYSKTYGVVIDRDSSALRQAVIASAARAASAGAASAGAAAPSVAKPAANECRATLEALRHMVDEEMTTGVLGLDMLAVADAAASIAAHVVETCGMQQRVAAIQQRLVVDLTDGDPWSAPQRLAEATSIVAVQPLIHSLSVQAATGAQATLSAALSGVWLQAVTAFVSILRNLSSQLQLLPLSLAPTVEVFGSGPTVFSQPAILGASPEGQAREKLWGSVMDILEAATGPLCPEDEATLKQAVRRRPDIMYLQDLRAPMACIMCHVAAGPAKDAALLAWLCGMGWGSKMHVRENKDTPLHHAVRAGDEEIASVLLAHASADFIDHPGQQGQTALHVAAGQGDARVVMLLVRCNFSPLARDASGRQPVDLASGRDARQIVSALKSQAAMRRSSMASTHSAAGTRARQDRMVQQQGREVAAVQEALLMGQQQRAGQRTDIRMKSPCPCGSGKFYKNCCGDTRKSKRRGKKKRR